MGAATSRMRGKIFALLKQLDATEHDDRMRILTAVLYRPVTSTNDLSFDDAKVCIETLQAIADRNDAEQHLERFVVEAHERMAGAR